MRTLGLVVACTLAVAQQSPVGPAAAAKSPPLPFGTNGGGVEFVDVMKQATWNSTDGLDASGWPTTDNALVLIDARHNMPWNGPDPTAIAADISGTYHLAFTGQATLFAFTEGDGATISDQVYDRARNTTTAALVLAPGHYLVGLSLTETRRRPGDAPGTGVTNLRVIRPGYPATSTQLITDATLRAYSPPFRSIRFLEAEAANDYAAFCGSEGTQLTEATWGNRVHATDAFQGGLPSANAGCNQAHGYAWEYMIMLANAGHHDMWINVPVDATDDYVLQLATLLHSGNHLTRALDPDLHVYLEYSNEVWNPSFPQQQYNDAVATREGVSQPQRYVERTLQLARIFRGVWGKDALNHQVRVVALWQQSTAPTMQAALRWAEQRFGEPMRQLLWGIGEAPYYGPSDTSSVDAIFDTLWTGSDLVRSELIGWQAAAAFFGLRQVAYESGPSLSAYPIYMTGIPTADRDPRIQASFVHHYLDNWFAVGGDLINFFSLRGTVTPFGNWFLYEDDAVFSRFDEPRLAAALKVLGASPPPLSAGLVLPWASGVSVELDPSQYVPFPFAAPQPPRSGLTIAPLGDRDPAFSTHDYLLRTTGSGSYAISVFGHASAAGAQLQVHVDDALVGTLALPPGGDQWSRALPVTVGPGFHTLWLVGAGTASTVLPAGTGTICVRSVTAHGAAVSPSAPETLTATPLDAGRIELRWASTTMATGYLVERSRSSGGPYEPVAHTDETTYVDAGLARGSSYYYVVAASNATGTGAVSPQVVAMTSRPQAPAIPGGLRVVRAGASYDLSQGSNGFLAGGEILLRWNATPDASSYTITRAPCLTGAFDGPCAVATQSATTYVDIGQVFFPPDPQVGLTYTYSVHASNAFGSSGESSAVTASPTVEVPEAPTNLTASLARGGVFLRWTPPFGMVPMFDPMQYRVYRSTAAAGPFAEVAAISTATFVDLTAVPGTTYFYAVAAAKTIGEGPQSNRVKVVVRP
jgi:fibronectin type 3 domain-containing protein